MEIVEGNIENFDELISKGVVLVDFFAKWCGPCKMLSLEIENVKDKIQVVKVDIDKNMELCKRYGVMSVPTLICFKDGVALKTSVGYITSDEILKFIKEA